MGLWIQEADEQRSLKGKHEINNKKNVKRYHEKVCSSQGQLC
jgi:hypothetical protein